MRGEKGIYVLFQPDYGVSRKKGAQSLSPRPPV